MRARDVMTENVACCTPQDSVQRAAQLMLECDCGCIPVVSDLELRKLVGMITDRDIAIRGVARGRGPDLRVADAMSEDVSCCGQWDSLDKVEEIMADRQVRRVPVIDGDGRCIGIIAQADLVRSDERPKDIKQVVSRISEPRSNGWSAHP